MPRLALIYEHEQWLAPLFAELDRREIDYVAIHADGMIFDLSLIHISEPTRPY